MTPVDRWLVKRTDLQLYMVEDSTCAAGFRWNDQPKATRYPRTRAHQIRKWLKDSRTRPIYFPDMPEVAVTVVRIRSSK